MQKSSRSDLASALQSFAFNTIMKRPPAKKRTHRMRMDSKVFDLLVILFVGIMWLVSHMDQKKIDESVTKLKSSQQESPDLNRMANAAKPSQ